MTIHWCGTGLSSGPGLRRLLAEGRPVTIWNRTQEEARAAVGDLTGDIRVFDTADLAGLLAPGDVVVSMMLAEHHPVLARLCIDKGAHFVCSSYATADLAALDGEAEAAGVVLLTEIGLDPGIDHLMAHDLVARYRASVGFASGNALSFLSYCGGFPVAPGPFRYKFSWSPLGVLKALRAPSRSIRSYSELAVERAWNAVTTFDAPAPVAERFEVYPNRDSLPYRQAYGFEPHWRLRDFTRGTLRPMGWAEAWAPVFERLEETPDEADDATLKAYAEQLWRDHAYERGEPDRVLLFVALRAEAEGRTVFHQTWALDAAGDERGQAMARLVSGMVALGVEAILARELPVGLQAATDDPKLIGRWLEAMHSQARVLRRIDHLT